MAKIRTKDKEFNQIFAARYGAFIPVAKYIAADCDVSYQAAYQWLKGDNSISLSRFLQFCYSARINPVSEMKYLAAEWEKINKSKNGGKKC